MSRNFFRTSFGRGGFGCDAVSARAADLRVKAPPLEVFTWAGFISAEMPGMVG